MWQGTVGLLNGQYKYLTAESFGHKINANGHVMKKKQQWSIELFPLTDTTSSSAVAAAAAASSSTNGNAVDELSEIDFVAIKSPLNCYLAVDSYGNVTCDSTEKTDKCRFIITICSMSSGGASEQIYWAFKNVVRNYYLGAGSDGMINCNAKMPQSRAELWHIHLQPARGATCFALRSIGRKRYARAVKVENAVQIKVDSPVAWGEPTLFQFRYWSAGQYALFTSDGKLLTSDGTCCVWPKMEEEKKTVNPDSPPPRTLFNIEFHSGFVAFRDEQGQYLAGTGHASILKSRSTSVSKDELFELELAPVQVALRAGFNSKWLSIKQGVDLTANQGEIGDEHETFQLEHLVSENQWRIQSKQGNYWAVAGSSIAANCADAAQAGLFKLHWNEDGSCSLQVSGQGSHFGKWICNRKSGQLCIGTVSNSPAGANGGQAPAEPVSFQLRLQNRKAFYLRSAQASGFVGLKTPDAGKLESAKGFPDSVQPVYDEPAVSGLGGCLFKMPANKRFWAIADGNLVRADATSAACAQSWVIELRSATAISIRTADTGLYLNNSAQGALQVVACEPLKATLWEF